MIADSKRRASLTVLPLSSFVTVYALALSFGLLSFCVLRAYGQELTLAVAVAIMQAFLCFVCILPLRQALDGNRDWLDASIYVGLFVLIYYGTGTLGLASRLVPGSLLTQASSLQGAPTVLLVVCTGLIAFLLAYRRPDIDRRTILGSLDSHTVEWLEKLYVRGTLFVWLVRLYLLSKGSWLMGYEFSPSRKPLTVLDSSLQIFSDFVATFIVAAAIFVIYTKGRHSKRSARIGWLVVVMELLFFGLTSWRRGILLTVLRIWIARALVAPPGRGSLRKPVIGLLLLFLLTFVFANSVRLNSYQVTPNRNPIVSLLFYVLPSAAADLVSTPSVVGGNTGVMELFYRMSAMDFMLGVHQQIATGADWLYGATIRSVIVIVPRFLWPGKPALTGEYHPQQLIQARLGLPGFDTLETPFTELYANFGIIGVLIGMFVSAKVLVWIQDLLFSKGQNNVGILVLYASTIVEFINMESNISLTWVSVIRNLLILVALLHLLAPSIKKMRRSYVLGDGSG